MPSCSAPRAGPEQPHHLPHQIPDMILNPGTPANCPYSKTVLTPRDVIDDCSKMLVLIRLVWKQRYRKKNNDDVRAIPDFTSPHILHALVEHVQEELLGVIDLWNYYAHL